MTASVTDDIAAGMAARHEGQSAVIAADKALNREHGDFIRAALDAYVTNGDTFSADDIRDVAARLAEDCGHRFDPSPNLLPAILGGAAASGRIVSVGWVNSTRRTRHASKNRVYRAKHPRTSVTTPHTLTHQHR